MTERQLDAFILFNQREEGVEWIVGQLESRGVSTYFWRRDIEAGESWESVESAKLSEALAVIVFLGRQGWGPTHLELVKKAAAMQKRLLPALVGDPPEGALDEAGGLFNNRRYVDLRNPEDTKAMDLLVRSIRQRPQTPHLEAIIGTLRDGNESQRAAVLEQIKVSTTLNRAALSARLRSEIEERFSPNAESKFASAIRDPKRIASIRSWLLSSLIWAGAEEDENRELILRHTTPWEPDRNVRFWALAQLYVRGASYVQAAAQQAVSDEAPEVNALARAVLDADDVKAAFESGLASDSFETVWPVLRTLRVVPVPELAGGVCAQLERALDGTPLAYDALYALSNPAMAAAAAPILAKYPGIAETVQRVLADTAASDPIAVGAFAAVLAALPEPEVDRALADAAADPATRDRARMVGEFLRDHRAKNVDAEVLVAGYASDTIDVKRDRLDIREDVYTLAAVMLASDVKPPLAIGLFGDWGSGKSFFMQSMRKATEELAASGKDKFCQDIVSIEFNAWHYADTNLWASMVSYILEQLAAYVTPQATAEQQEAALVAQLGSAKAMVQEAEGEKRRTQELIKSRADELQKAQLEREQKEIRLRDLRASDFRSLMNSNADLKKQVESALDQMGVPAVLDSASDLNRLAAEAASARGRMTALFASVLSGRTRPLTITLMAVVLLVIPGLAYLLRSGVADDFFVRIGAVAAQVVTVLVGAKKVLSKAFEQVKTNLGRVEAAKREVDKLLAAKRQELSQEEQGLQQEIAALKAKEQQSEARLSAAAARVAELEERIKSARQGRSLAQFLAERTRSDDYRKYLGLISIIRQDFDALGKRLSGAIPEGAGFRRVDRIILYIDDLDRCPEEKVMEVLQAVHLLLAYPLFVVVVGVDPRWLLHSLKGTFRAFRGGRRDGASANGETWRTTPQNYLEKIFQIPFSLRPMTPDGYGRLVGSLLTPAKEAEAPPQTVPKKTEPESTPPEGAQQAAAGGAKPSDAKPGPAKMPAKQPEGTPQPKPAPFVVHEEALAVQPWEAAFAERLFPLIPTPRAAKRFSNVYRILKAPVQRHKLRAFEGTNEVPGEFQVPMLLLAMLVGAPAEVADAFPRLWREAAEGRGMADALHCLSSSEELRALQEKIRPIASDSAFPSSADLLRDWLPRVARFSFDVGRAVESSRQAPAARKVLAAAI